MVPSSEVTGRTNKSMKVSSAQKSDAVILNSLSFSFAWCAHGADNRDS